MSTVQTSEGTARIRVENVGGIDETEVEFRPGVNLLTGRNASNRTSLLQAIMAALGSDRVSLKGDADEGRVELTLGDETYTRSISRTDDGIALDGDPAIGDPELADLFAFLLESNDARRAVARSDDLRDIIMRPVDTAAVRAEIEELESRRQDVETELEERERLADELASLERERDDLRERIEAKRRALEAKRDEIDAADAEIEETRERKAELESELSALQDRRSTLEDVRFRLETERETVDGLREELDGVEADLADLPDPERAAVDDLESRTGDLRDRKRALDSKINQIQALVQFNEEMLSDEGVDELDLFDAADDAGDVTERLLPGGGSFVCWTCGRETTREDVEAALDELRERRGALVAERSEVTAELEETKERRAELVERERRREELERRRDDLAGELRDAGSEIESLEERRAELVEEIEKIEAAVEALREAEYDEIVDLHREANELELEVEGLEDDLDRTEERLASTRERLDEMADLESERETLRTRLEEARTRIERLEDEAIAAFNDHMDTVLDVLDYENVERIWIERVEREVREGRRKVDRGFFDLHVVRSTGAGAVYEDTVDHLSESEREVTGLVFALAGYLAHEVHETTPFVLLDSIEAIDSDRIASLVEHLSDHAEYLVVALLPEDAAAVGDEYPRISDI